MKKQSIFTIVAIIAVFAMSSCSSYTAKDVTLNNQNDSLNYTLGLANGNGIKNYYLRTDSSNEAISVLMKAIDQAYSAKSSKDEMYNLGKQIGSSFSQQMKRGLMGDTTVAFNKALVMQGMLNALNDYKQGMSPVEAEVYIRKVMTAKQQAKMKHAPAPAPAAVKTKEPKKK